QAANRWRYAGKEEQDIAGMDLRLLDFGARYYDSFTCRWNAVDPLAHKYFPMSPYNYCGNDPVNKFDPDGRDVKISVSNEPVGTTAINLYSSAERKADKTLQNETMTVPVYAVEITNESGQSNTYYFTRIGYRKDINNKESPATEVTFDVKNDGETFPAVIRDRWGEENYVLEIRSAREIKNQTVTARKAQEDCDRTAIQFHVKGATDGCLMCVGKSQFISIADGVNIRSDLPSTSSRAQSAFMNDIISYQVQDDTNKKGNNIYVSFKQLYK
ncbi:MAG: RHS repeat-associated core domain-containing protein, partial [Bacteroidales bacterium]|nr:RHS repeat-associated core domain-containing protein [Bacteroidales bacterium]